VEEGYGDVVHAHRVFPHPGLPRHRRRHRAGHGRRLAADRAAEALSGEADSAYECGFEAFDDARTKFDVRFYLVAILFIIFDLEVAFLFPWAVSAGEVSACSASGR
jgi:NADH:ubiquinone oxidoreductase subunit 3 (subunit A)